MVQKKCSSALLQEVTLRLCLLIFPRYYNYIDLSPNKKCIIDTERCEKVSEIFNVNVTGSKKYCSEKDAENSREAKAVTRMGYERKTDSCGSFGDRGGICESKEVVGSSEYHVK